MTGSERPTQAGGQYKFNPKLHQGRFPHVWWRGGAYSASFRLAGNPGTDGVLYGQQAPTCARVCIKTA